MARFSLVVVTWECAPYLRALVDSMNRHLRDEPELVVVDNASSDDPEAAARRWRGETTFIRMDENVGYGAANNAGVAAAGGEAVVLLNPDTELIDPSLERLAALALSRAALAGPRLLNADDSVQPSASGTPVGIWPWIGAILPGRIQPAPLRARTEPWRLGRTTRVAWLTGACVAGPRTVLRSLGPFDPALHLYGEDMDLGIRAARAGIRSYFCPELSRIVHHGGGSASLLHPWGGEAAAERNRRAVLRRAYGGRTERAAWLAHRLNLRLRVVAKAALGRDAARDRAALTATLSARRVTELPPPPSQPV